LKERRVISVFGSSAPSPGSEAFEEARQVGRLLAEAGCAVATGGYGGTMSAISQGAAEAGGHVIGVASARIERFRGTEVNRWVHEVHKYDSLVERLLHLVTRNDGMIVLPGGIGTLSELVLAWSLMQVGEIDNRPLVLLGGMWRDTIQAFFQAEYIEQWHLNLLRFAETPAAAVAHVLSRRNKD
jgi:uncharacterized protein (TIGR00730 family)